MRPTVHSPSLKGRNQGLVNVQVVRVSHRSIAVDAHQIESPEFTGLQALWAMAQIRASI